MKTESNIRARQSVLSPIVLSLLVAGIMGLVWSGASTEAATGQVAQLARGSAVGRMAVLGGK